jgi:hypothetical protein
MKRTFAVGIGGAAGQGVATPGDIFAKIFSRRGLHLYAYNAYQSIIRGGHTFLTVRTGPEKSPTWVTVSASRRSPRNPFLDRARRPQPLQNGGGAVLEL